jgi:hypothetical protein
MTAAQRRRPAYIYQTPDVLLEKPGMHDAWLRLMRQIRPFSAGSLVDLALQLLWHKSGSALEDLRIAPWQLLLLVKWALQDPLVHLRVGLRMPMFVMDQIRQSLWDMPGNVRPPTPASGIAFFRSMLHAQVDFQRAETWSFMRWPALIATCAGDHPLRREFRHYLGMEPDAYMDLAFLFQGNTLSGERTFDPAAFANLRSSYGNHIDQMFHLYARDLPALRAELRKPEAQEVRGRGELSEFPYLRRFPLVKLRNGQIACWHPLVLARGLEEGVHLRLSAAGERYTKAFSKVFENYVVQLGREARLNLVDEKQYKAAVGSNVRAVEAIVRDGDCTVLIEAKMSLFSDAVLVTDDPRSVYHKTKRVAAAVDQAWTVVDDLLSSTHPLFSSECKTHFLLVVTSRELHLGRGTHLEEIYPAGSLKPSHSAARALPVNHIYVVSIEDFERLMGCVTAGEVTLSRLLRECVAMDSDPQTATFYLGDHLGRYTRRFQNSSLVQAAIDGSQRRLEHALAKQL